MDPARDSTRVYLLGNLKKLDPKCDINDRTFDIDCT